MPRALASMTLGGCALILFGGLLIYFRSQSGKHQRELQRHLCSAHNVGEIEYNTIQFPPFLLRTEILRSTKKNAKLVGQRNESLRDYTITEMTLDVTRIPPKAWLRFGGPSLKKCAFDCNWIRRRYTIE